MGLPNNNNKALDCIRPVITTLKRSVFLGQNSMKGASNSMITRTNRFPKRS